jgi:hypothetical protein
MAKKISICTAGLPTEIFTQAIIEVLLSIFCMFDPGAFNPGCLRIFINMYVLFDTCDSL